MSILTIKEKNKKTKIFYFSKILSFSASSLVGRFFVSAYSTVTDFAKLRGLSIEHSRNNAIL